MVKEFGLSDEQTKTLIHAKTSSFNKTVYDPYINLLRATTESMASVIGGCDSLSVRPFDESLSTVFGVIATFLTIIKVLTNWIYWIVIDLFSVWLYLARDSEIYAAQMFLFTVLAVYGYYQWRKEYRSIASA